MLDPIRNAYHKGVYLKKWVLWVFAALLVLVTTATATASVPTGNAVVQSLPVPILNSYGMPAPFLKSWIPIWLFGLAGGIGAVFFKIEAIDKHFRSLLIAKPFLGLFGSLALCLLMATGAEPPRTALTAYAFIAALLSAPILQALLAVASLKQNQVELLNKINPFKFKIVAPGDIHKYDGEK